jgi:ubiquitin carboxyl-terminal hydrolase 7
LLNIFDDRYVGRLFVKGSGKPLEILTKLNEMAGFAPDQEIELYEVSLPHLV